MSAPELAEFKLKAQVLGVDLTEQCLDSLSKYCVDLMAYNQHTNLVGQAQPDIIFNDHILGSCALVPLVRELGYGSGLVDIGSGAGFPGLVLAIVCPGLKVVLIESITKKATFLNELTTNLGLQDQVMVLNDRAEVVAHIAEYRNQFSLATARAVATIDVVAELAIPLLKLGGYLLAQKSSRQLEHEQMLAAKCLPLLGACLREVKRFNNDLLGKDHVVLQIEKIAKTDRDYPRSAAQIKRHPLGGNSGH